MRSSKNSLFLMELMLSILFFALTGAVCLQLFVKAHTLSQETINLNHSVTLSQNLADIFLAENGSLTEFPSLFDSQKDCMSIVTDSNGTICSFGLCYDAEWNPHPAELDMGAAYFATITYTEQDTTVMRNARIIVCDAFGHELYSLVLSKYVPREVSHE